MIWAMVVLGVALAVALYVKHARLAGPLAFLLGVVIAAGPVGHGILLAIRAVALFFGVRW